MISTTCLVISLFVLFIMFADSTKDTRDQASEGKYVIVYLLLHISCLYVFVSMTAAEPSIKKSKGSRGMHCSYTLRILQMCLFCCAFREERKERQ